MRNMQLERYRIIVSRLSRWGRRAVSKKELAELCDISEERIKKDIKGLRDRYDAPIHYNRREKAYELTSAFALPSDLALGTHEVSKLKTAIQVLTQYKHLALFQGLNGLIDKIEKAVTFRLERKRSDEFIFFEEVTLLRGLEYIDFFVEQIETRTVVSFEYQKFNQNVGDTKKRIIHPHFIKEHRNRWYVIGKDEESGQVRVFGFDRLRNPDVNDAYKYQPADYVLSDFAPHNFGLYLAPKSETETVRLAFAASRMPYLLTKAFHMQQVERGFYRKGDRYVLDLDIVINQELVMELARLGAEVQVLEPKSLRERVRNYLEAASRQYDE
ncbi:MAG: WYL domain-containing protein [Bernardetiaceae bacterium]|nr:WYL domain-containing protein [Bernardetiaceae bacterium]